MYVATVKYSSHFTESTALSQQNWILHIGPKSLHLRLLLLMWSMGLGHVDRESYTSKVRIFNIVALRQCGWEGGYCPSDTVVVSELSHRQCRVMSSPCSCTMTSGTNPYLSNLLLPVHLPKPGLTDLARFLSKIVNSIHNNQQSVGFVVDLPGSAIKVNTYNLTNLPLFISFWT